MADDNDGTTATESDTVPNSPSDVEETVGDADDSSTDGDTVDTDDTEGNGDTDGDGDVDERDTIIAEQAEELESLKALILELQELNAELVLATRDDSDGDTDGDGDTDAGDDLDDAFWIENDDVIDDDWEVREA